MADQIAVTELVALDASGAIVSDATLFVFQAGTTTPQEFFQDSGLATSLGTSEPFEANGRFEKEAWVASGTAVKIDVRDGTGASLPGYPRDNYPTHAESGQAASGVSFTPVTGNSATTAQAAIANNTEKGNRSDNALSLRTTGGSSNAYTLTPSVTVAAYAEGQTYHVRVNHANTGAATLAVSGLSAQNIKKLDTSNAKVDVVAGDLIIGQTAILAYDGVDFILTRAAQIATEDVPGIVELATDAESAAGTAGKIPDAAQVATRTNRTVSVFTASSTWNRPTGCTKVDIIVTGSGGGGGYNTTGNPAGYGGATALKYGLDVTSIASATITIGAGGTGSNVVTAGSNSSWADGTNTITGTGAPTTGDAASTVATGGDINLTVGQPDADTFGGPSYWGQGSNRKISPVDAVNPGSGGGSHNGSSTQGADGADGIVVVMEYYGG